MRTARGLTLVEGLVVLLLVLLFISMVPGLLPRVARESAKRSVCAANLGGNGKALAIYANQHRGWYPHATATRFRDSGSPDKGLTSNPAEGHVLMFDGVRLGSAEAAQPLHRWQAIIVAGEPTATQVLLPDRDASYASPTRDLFLLVKQGLAQPGQFVCPSTGHEQDALQADQPGHPVPAELGVTGPSQALPAAQLWDFLHPDTLDYGYMFAHDANGEKGNENIDPQCPVMADSNPYVRDPLYGFPAPEPSNTRNSSNHLGEGQNVLYADGHVGWSDKPTVGVGGDNIYTAWYSAPDKPSEPTQPGQAPKAIPGDPNQPPMNYHFDIVSRTDTLLLP